MQSSIDHDDDDNDNNDDYDDDNCDRPNEADNDDNNYNDDYDDDDDHITELTFKCLPMMAKQYEIMVYCSLSQYNVPGYRLY